jgi:hypothetical protein
LEVLRMPVHDWTRVETGIFHTFHHSWIEELRRALNTGLLPDRYYALVEQHAALGTSDGGASLLLSPPQVPLTAETEMEFYRRKQNAVVVRDTSGDRIVAVVEVVSPGNKAGRSAIHSFVKKAAGLLERRIHLLILDLHPPTRRDPQGIHGVIWEEITGEEYVASEDRPLSLAAYESGLTVRAYVEPVAVGDTLADMPLFLEPGRYVPVPLESTYVRAFAALPRRWRVVLEEAD